MSINRTKIKIRRVKAPMFKGFIYWIRLYIGQKEVTSCSVVDPDEADFNYKKARLEGACRNLFDKLKEEPYRD